MQGTGKWRNRHIKKLIGMSIHLPATQTVSDKRRLPLLDALRGVAALIVVYYHCYEGFALSFETQVCAHGFLAVDFFFMLSGFVTGYAYDDRWRGMSLAQFFRRRLLRLHPMLVIGVLWGVIAYFLGGCLRWDGTQTSLSTIAIAALMSLFLIPCLPSGPDLRGYGEIFSLNGPHWSMFFEYMGNILYAIWLRRLSTRVLSCLVAITAALLIWTCFSFGRLDFGWGFIDYALPGTDIQVSGFFFGMVRLLFPYGMGLLLSQLFIHRQSQGKTVSLSPSLTFWASAVVLAFLLTMPYINTPEKHWIEPTYLVFCIIFVFPTLIWTAAHAADTKQSYMSFLGDISYPLYAIHYPGLYLLFAYVGFPNTHTPMSEVWPIALGIAVGSIVMAWLLQRYYERPVRQWMNG